MKGWKSKREQQKQLPTSDSTMDPKKERVQSRYAKKKSKERKYHQNSKTKKKTTRKTSSASKCCWIDLIINWFINITSLIENHQWIRKRIWTNILTLWNYWIFEIILWGLCIIVVFGLARKAWILVVAPPHCIICQRSRFF